MEDKSYVLKKATVFSEIQAVVDHRIPVGPEHEFYTELKDVRGDYIEREFYKLLFINPDDFSYYNVNRLNKTILFVAGHRGSGKSSEIKKWVKNLEKTPRGYFCVVCNVDEDLDMNDIEYVDIIIFQLEKLIQKLLQRKIPIDDSIISQMEKWFTYRISEMNKKLESKIELETEVKVQGMIPYILEILGKLRTSVTGKTERTDTIRKEIKNNFSSLTSSFNIFIEDVVKKLQNNNQAQEILFVIDGLEKTNSPELRKRIILDESNRILSLKVNVLFTLPIELMQEKSRLNNFSNTFSFPFIKIIEKDNSQVAKAYKKLREFVYKRVDESLFEDEKIIDAIITYSGGSPRELLRILEQCAIRAEGGKIDSNSLQRAVKKLSSEYLSYLYKKDLETLKDIDTNNKKGQLTDYSNELHDLLEKHIVFEYNDGTYRRVNPLVECTEHYKKYVYGNV